MRERQALRRRQEPSRPLQPPLASTIPKIAPGHRRPSALFFVCHNDHRTENQGIPPRPHHDCIPLTYLRTKEIEDEMVSAPDCRLALEEMLSIAGQEYVQCRFPRPWSQL